VGVPGHGISFGPGWDRQSTWTLRFVDPGLERAYLAATAGPGRLRLRVACTVGIPLWLTAAALGPPFLNLPVAPILIAALVNCGWEALMILLTFRSMSLQQAWALAFVTTSLGTIGIVIALGVGPAFVAGAAPTLMLNGVTGIALVRMTAWLAATIGLVQVTAFCLVAAYLGTGPATVFQAFLLLGTMMVASLGSRYLEGAERRAFAQGYLVADLHRRIDRLFRQYLSPDVAQALVDDPDRAELGGEVAEVSVLFADLRGYTPFSERTAPADVVAMLNASFGAAVPAVFAEGGTIVQFVGDALMAIFNAPLRQGDHAARACRAGLALQASMSAIEGDDRPRFRVGINTGPALVGNIGSPELRNFSALGDTTNVAARLQTYAQPGTVVIGDRTYDLVRDLAKVRQLGDLDLKGKSVPTRAFELLSLDQVRTSKPVASAAI
jgi:class 3 adenylate cyclase